jgi:hypothetical protein
VKVYWHDSSPAPGQNDNPRVRRTTLDEMFQMRVNWVSEIIGELTRLQGLSPPDISGDREYPIPGLIPTGTGDGLLISRNVDLLISWVARDLLKGKEVETRSFTDAEWIAEVRNAFGAALARIDLDDPLESNTKQVLSDVQGAIDRQTVTQVAREYAFGCTLFSNQDITSFNIGPVLFETRVAWLARRATAGNVTKVAQQRIMHAWLGKRIRKRKPSFDSIIENDILDMTCSCPYVCSVMTDGLAPEAGKEKALTAARLAFTAIALLWETPSKALDGFNLAFDRKMHGRRFLSFGQGSLVTSSKSKSHMPHGPHLHSGDWERTLQTHRDHFMISGEILEYILSPNGRVMRPRLMNALAQALLWYHQACRDPEKLMGVVDFAAAMDALASGRKARGILSLLTARFGIDANDPIRVGGPSVKSAIEHIYSDGRSRTIHGTNDRLGNDWSVTRGQAESFARLCLVGCIDWAANNPASDDPLLLLQ